MVFLNSNNDPQAIFDRHYALKCPRCGIQSNISVVSVPRYEYLLRFKPSHIGLVYRCDACNSPVFLKFSIQHDFGNSRVEIQEEFEEVQRPQESFDFKYLPGEVSDDFREALACYSTGAFNGFAAMCRRTVQTVSVELGAHGTDKVLNQLRDLKEMAQIDDETFDVLRQVVIDGHDGAHPHLPRLNSTRAAVLLELMKDVLYQLYVRKGKLQEAMALRQAAAQQRT